MKKPFYLLQRISIMASMMSVLLISLFGQMLFAANDSGQASSSKYLSSSPSLHHEISFAVLVDNDDDDQDDVVYNWHPSDALISLENSFDIHFEENQVASVSYFTQSHSAVPLFVLFHSWKSFLS
jgi:hypothetical protein